MHDDPQPAEAVEVYWRPGCGFCSTLRRDLHRTGLPLHEINIWNDQDAATLVRRAAGGSETVPTVVIGPHALVNPTVDEVMAAVAAHAPHLLPTQQPPRPAPECRGAGGCRWHRSGWLRSGSGWQSGIRPRPTILALC
jgi:mycoredoxin